MSKDDILDRISRGRTDLVFDLLALPDGREALKGGRISALQWFVYYGDVTALKAALAAGVDLSGLDLNAELGNAAFNGHWKACDFLIAHGADVRHANADTGETALHNAVSKAGQPYRAFTVRLLLERGADPNARTIPDRETGAFMRDVRTKGETPLHRAAALCDASIIQLLLDYSADVAAQDAHGDTPISWASWHLRPGAILHLLQHGAHRIGASHVNRITADHGAGWGDGMSWNFVGDYLPESVP